MPRFLSRVAMLGAATGTTPTVIGGNTSSNDGGAVFGTDTPLYRAGADVLRCNQLDQTVPPVKAYSGSGGLSGTLSTGTTVVPAIAAFTMPFKGDFVMNAWVNVQANTTGLLLAGARASNMPAYLAPTLNNQAIQRLIASGGEWVWIALPVLGAWTNVAAGASMYPAIEITQGGGVPFVLNAYQAIGIATRTL